MFKIEAVKEVADNTIAINGVEFKVTDEIAEMVYNLVIGKQKPRKASNAVKEDKPIVCGYHIETEKYNGLYIIGLGEKLSTNGKYYTDAYSLRYTQGAKDWFKAQIEALNGVEKTSRTFTDARGKERTYMVYGFKKKADAEKALETLPRTLKGGESNDEV